MEVLVLAKTKNTNQRIVVALDTELDNLELFSFKSDAAYVLDANTQERPIDYKLVSGLHGSWRSGNGFEGKLAEHWELSPDGLRLTFHIRPGVTFHNGNPVNAQAFKHSYDRHICLAGGSSKTVMDLALGSVEGASPDQVEVVDDYTVRLHLAKPSPLLLELLTTTVVPIIDPLLTEAHATREDPWAREYWKTATIGTGPYKLGRIDPGVQWEMVPYENYWDKKALKNGGIVFKVVPSAQARLEMLRRGEVDVVWGVPFGELKELDEDPGFKVISFVDRGQNFMVINHAIKPFEDLKVRQAVLYSLPYCELIERASWGYAKPLQSPFPGGMPTADFSYWLYGEGKNYQKARELLAEVGHGEGFDTELYVHEGKQADMDSALLIRDALAEVGIRVRVVEAPSDVFFDALSNRRVPLIIHYFYPFVNDPFLYANYTMKSDGVANFWNYKNPEVDRLIYRGILEPDAAQREMISKKIQKIFVEEAVYANLFSQKLVFVTSASVSGFIAHNDGLPRFYEMHREDDP